MTKITSIAVYCGASKTINNDFLQEAYALGQMLAKKGIKIVYGGNKYGIMGALADGALAAAGVVTGVLPVNIIDEREIAHPAINLITVPDMHTRKITMFNLSDAFVILPGALGTMDELFEVLTWKLLKTHNKPIIIYNYAHYFDNLDTLIKGFISNGFADPSITKLYEMVDSTEAILQKLSY